MGKHSRAVHVGIEDYYASTPTSGRGLHNFINLVVAYICRLISRKLKHGDVKGMREVNASTSHVSDILLYISDECHRIPTLSNESHLCDTLFGLMIVILRYSIL